MTSGTGTGETPQNASTIASKTLISPAGDGNTPWATFDVERQDRNAPPHTHQSSTMSLSTVLFTQDKPSKRNVGPLRFEVRRSSRRDVAPFLCRLADRVPLVV